MTALTDWSKLLDEAEIKNALRERKKDYEEKTIFRSALHDEAEEGGWSLYKDTKNPKKIKVRRQKSPHVNFENRLWVLFASMGFGNLDRKSVV